MKRNKYHIIRAWMLLLCFVAGQFMVYSHQHKVYTGKISYQNQKNQPKQVLTENCQLCDAMHHNNMAISTQVHFAPVAVKLHVYKQVEYGFISIALVLAAGRSPPLA